MKGTTILKGFLLLLAAVFIVHQCISSFYKPIKTEIAVHDTASDGIKITGLIIRNETLVKSDSSGVLHFIIDDGSRVAKNGIIANIYDSENASITLSQIDVVKQKIEDINDLQSYNNIEAADLDLINTKVEEGLNNMIVSGSAGNFENFTTYSEDLLTVINRRQVAMGVTTDFSAQLTSLNSQLATLSGSLPNAKGQVTAEQSGYFVSKVDGYENVLKCDNLDTITPEYLGNIKAEAIDGNVIGKIVSDYKWYISAEVDINDSLKFKEGDTLKIHTAIKSFPVLPVTVEKINISESNSKAVILFACSDMNSELASMRSGPMTVVKNEYSGLKVAKSALRVREADDGTSQTGVYVVTGLQVKFVPVNVLYSNNSYMICEQQTSDTKVLRLYDKVVVKGKNLRDGKIIS